MKPVSLLAMLSPSKIILIYGQHTKGLTDASQEIKTVS